MRFAFIARHRNIWPVAWLCDTLAGLKNVQKLSSY
jgi:hypothetical protein